MSVGKHAQNAAQHAKGEAEEAWGKATDDQSTRMKGKADQAKADIKEKIEEAKEHFDDR